MVEEKRVERLEEGRNVCIWRRKSQIVWTGTCHEGLRKPTDEESP